MDSISRLAKAIKGRPGRSGVSYGIWVAAEATDLNLSQVLVPGANLDGSDMTLRFVPKGEHVTGLTTTSTVLMIGNPLCIVAKVIGDISTAAV